MSEIRSQKTKQRYMRWRKRGDFEAEGLRTEMLGRGGKFVKNGILGDSVAAGVPAKVIRKLDKPND